MENPKFRSKHHRPQSENMSSSAAAAADVFAGYRPPDWPYWNTEASDPVPPVDPLVRECFDEMSQFYLDAARRLPIADVPYLATSLAQSGLAVGLCDPVTNILLTALHGFALEKESFPGLVVSAGKEEALKQASDKLTFVDAVHRSRLGLIDFMLCYFRYLTHDEDKQCLTMAGHNLPLAVLLVEKACGSSRGLPDPDSATTKAALKEAADGSDHQTLVHLMTSRYEPRVAATIKQVLCDTTQQLTKQQVSEICDLLCQPCSPPPPTPTITTRTFRDSNGQVTTTIVMDTHLLLAPAVSQDGVSMATITSSARTSHGDTGVPLSTALTKATIDEATVGRSCRQCVTTWFLRMSLLDTVHELYIKALAQLPMDALHRRHLIRAVLAAGHTYGPMAHPVANIMFNTIWYDALFPFRQDDLPAAADILDSRSMSRVESRSLDAIVALVRKSYSVSQRKALVQLCRDRRKLKLWSSQDFRLVQRNIDDLLQAAKHPQPDAYAAFIKYLTLDEVRDMRGLIVTDQVMSDAAAYQLKDMITKIAAERGIAAGGHTPALSKSTLEILSPRRSAFKIKQDYVRGKLEILLADYSLRQGQKDRVGIICGVASRRYYNIQCYHVNFLANMDIGVPNGATPTPMHKLFFAEFWDKTDQRIEESTKPPICCVVQDYSDHFGRCNVCESTSSTIIVHPPSCGYFMANEGAVFPSAESLREADPGMLDIDFIYFDAAKDDIESARMKPRWTAGKTIRPT